MPRTTVYSSEVNENDKQRIKAMFPHASSEFLSLNLGFGVRPVDGKQNKRPALGGEASREVKSDERPIVGIKCFRVRLLDKENLYGSTKCLTDCLREVGLIPGDSEKEIDLQVSQEKVAHRNEQRTKLTITYP